MGAGHKPKILAATALAAALVAGLMLLRAQATETDDPADPQADVAAGVDPARDFDRPGVHRIDAGRYLAVIDAFSWGFNPSEIRVPAGSEVTFRARALDGEHGFAIEGTDVSLSLNTGGVSEATHTFQEPGEYRFLCDQYCGGGHTSMNGRIIVE